MTISWKWAIKYVDEFVSSSDLENIGITHFAHRGCSAVNGCRQNEVQTADKKHNNNPQVIHSTPIHQL